MEKGLLVYGIIGGLILAAVYFYSLRSDESRARRWASVRVRVEDRGRRDAHRAAERLGDPGEDDFDPGQSLQWLILGAVVVLVCLLAAGSG